MDVALTGLGFGFYSGYRGFKGGCGFVVTGVEVWSIVVVGVGFVVVDLDLDLDFDLDFAVV